MSHSWIDPNPYYKGRKCLVCGKTARGDMAPMGIVSGRFPCHHRHTDREIISAYLEWCLERQEQKAQQQPQEHEA